MSFRAVNSSSLAVAVPPPVAVHQSLHHITATPAMTTTTPTQPPVDDLPVDHPSLKTPTRDSFAGIAGQKPLPSLPASALNDLPDNRMSDADLTPKTDDHEVFKSEEDGEDIEMEDASSPKDSDESLDDGKGGKKKKGQRFYCSDYPPCALSFTRSEHLARHIRKHTGERPFQCHCNRRFSRLDNLRQHAQTVHVNEDIPMDSLAASGTRFQRQIRTERARPVNRSRSSTFTSGVAPPHMQHIHRGHSRNHSSSSITSMSSVSTLGGDDYRRAPHSFETPRTNRLSLDTYQASSPTAAHLQPYYGVGSSSPTGYSTPTSTSFSHANSSPRFSSGVHSPISSASRSMYWGASKTPHRRLSIGGSTPFQSSHSPDSQVSHMSPAPSNAALQRHSQYAASPAPSTLDSPRDSPGTPVESDYRRHTWGPQINTQLRRPRTEPNVLTANHISDLPRPVFPSMEQSSQVTRLPGIHTFDQPPPPSSLLGAPRASSPMHLDPTPTSHPIESATKSSVAQHPNRGSWTSGIQSSLNRLEITNDNSRPTSWASSNRSSGVVEPLVRHAPARGHSRHVSESSITSAPQPIQTTPTARKNKRMGWYIQPPSHQQVPNTERPSPDSSDGAPTPVTTSSGFQPAIVQGNGHMEPQGLAIHVEEPSKAAFGQFQPPRIEHRVSLPPRPQESLPNPFGLQKLHENSPAEHFHPTARHARHSSHHIIPSTHHIHQPIHQAQGHHIMHKSHQPHAPAQPTHQPPQPAQHAHNPSQHIHQSVQQVHQLEQHAPQPQHIHQLEKHDYQPRASSRGSPEHYKIQSSPQNDTRRLDALVAVATSEEQRA